MFEELVVEVSEAESRVVPRASLEDMGLKERTHLQEWVVANPEVLGAGTQIIATELDRWQTHDGRRVQDRLDVLGIDPDGRLVVAELKRGSAPHAMNMQAISYAAMVSRLTLDDVAELLASAPPATRERLSLPDPVDEIATALQTQMGMPPEGSRNPRIVLIAADFPPTVTSSVVWLGERQVDISLVRVRTYQLDGGRAFASFVRIYPIPDAEEFTIGKRTLVDPYAADVAEGPPWDEESLCLLADKANLATLTLLDLCAQRDGEQVTIQDIANTSGLTAGQVRGQLAGLTMLLKNPSYGLSRPVWPVLVTANPQGLSTYQFRPGLDVTWRTIRGLSARSAEDEADHPRP